MSQCDCNQGRLECTCKGITMGDWLAEQDKKTAKIIAWYHCPDCKQQHYGDVDLPCPNVKVVMSQCECSDQSACACGTPDPSLWVPCSPAWIEAGGNCATAPRLSGVTGRGVSHYHPPHVAVRGDHHDPLETGGRLADVNVPAAPRMDSLDKEIMRNSFEANYADWSGRELQNVQAQRLGDTYGQPKIASAWRWYQCGKGVPL